MFAGQGTAQPGGQTQTLPVSGLRTPSLPSLPPMSWLTARFAGAIPGLFECPGRRGPSRALGGVFLWGLIEGAASAIVQSGARLGPDGFRSHAAGGRTQTSGLCLRTVLDDFATRRPTGTPGQLQAPGRPSVPSNRRRAPEEEEEVRFAGGCALPCARVSLGLAQGTPALRSSPAGSVGPARTDPLPGRPGQTAKSRIPCPNDHRGNIRGERAGPQGPAKHLPTPLAGGLWGVTGGLNVPTIR